MAKIVKLFLGLMFIFPIYSMDTRIKRKRHKAFIHAQDSESKRRKVIPFYEQKREAVRKARARYFSQRFNEYIFY